MSVMTRNVSIPVGYVKSPAGKATHFTFMRETGGGSVSSYYSAAPAPIDEMKNIFTSNWYDSQEVALVFLKKQVDSKKQKLQEKVDNMQTEIDGMNDELRSMK